MIQISTSWHWQVSNYVRFKQLRAQLTFHMRHIQHLNSRSTIGLMSNYCLNFLLRPKEKVSFKLCWHQSTLEELLALTREIILKMYRNKSALVYRDILTNPTTLSSKVQLFGSLKYLSFSLFFLKSLDSTQRNPEKIENWHDQHIFPV